MLRRVAVAVALLAVTVTVASGCGGTPAPVETTADALTEDEAFAAAEETYRAYVDALNQVDLADPETFEAVYALTTGEANAYFRQSFSEMHADGWSVDGASIPSLVELDDFDGEFAVDLAICLDVTAVKVLNADGTSMVEESRPDVQSMRVTVIDSGTWKVDKIDGREGEPSCVA